MRILHILLVLIGGLAVTASLEAQLFQRPSMEYRTLNTPDYEVRVQKNGRIDIILTSGMTLFENLQPGILYADKDRFTPMRLRPAQSGRELEKGALGEGHALVIGGDDGDWRIVAYPTRPRFTVQMTYTNRSRREVSVRALAPFAVADRNRGAFRVGPSAAQAWLLHEPSPGPVTTAVPALTRGSAEALDYLAVYNPLANLSVVMGFLSARQAWGQIRIEQLADGAADVFAVLEAASYYDPPKIVGPGESLRSELFFVSMERNWRDGSLREFGAARRAANGLSYSPPPPAHGWEVEASATQVASALADVTPQHLAAGWKHLSLSPQWARKPGDWRPDPERFPDGLAASVAAVHGRGLTLGLQLDPFVLAQDSPLALEHPHWIQAHPELTDGLALLDTTQPEVYAYLRQLAHTIAQDWRLDGIEVVGAGTGALLDGLDGAAHLTRTEALHLGLAALREGLGAGKSLYTGAPQLVGASYAQGFLPDRSTTPRWQSQTPAQSHGAAESLAAGIRAYFLAEFSPHIQGPVYLNPSGAAGDRQRQAWLTGAALLGAGIRLGELPGQLDAASQGLMAKVLPVAPTPARPLDLFQADAPEVWSLRYGKGPEDPAMTWDLLAVFNWAGDGEKVTRLYLEQFGLDPQAFYTVYDFWAGSYEGTASRTLDVAVPPASMRLFGLRRFDGAAHFVGSDHHFAMGAAHHSRIQDLRAEQVLEGTCTALPGQPQRFTYLLPPGYQFDSFDVSDGEATIQQNGQLIHAHILPTSNALTWKLHYTQE